MHCISLLITIHKLPGQVLELLNDSGNITPLVPMTRPYFNYSTATTDCPQGWADTARNASIAKMFSQGTGSAKRSITD